MNLSAVVYALKELTSRISEVGKGVQSEIKSSFSPHLSSYLEQKDSKDGLPKVDRINADKIPEEGFARIRFKNNLSYDAFVSEDNVMLFTYNTKKDDDSKKEGLRNKTELFSTLKELDFSKADILGPVKDRNSQEELSHVASIMNTFVSDTDKHLEVEFGEPHLRKIKDDGGKLKLALSLVESSGESVWKDAISEGFALLSKIKDNALLPHTGKLYKDELETMTNKFSSLLIDRIEKDDPFFRVSNGSSKFSAESIPKFIEGIKDEVDALKATGARPAFVKTLESFIKVTTPKPSFRVVGVFPKEDITSKNTTKELEHLLQYKGFQRSLFKNKDKLAPIEFDKDKGIVINDTSLLPDHALINEVKAFMAEEKEQPKGLEGFMSRVSSDESISSVFGLSSSDSPKKEEVEKEEAEKAVDTTPASPAENSYDFEDPFGPGEVESPSDFEDPFAPEEEKLGAKEKVKENTPPPPAPTFSSAMGGLFDFTDEEALEEPPTINTKEEVEPVVFKIPSDLDDIFGDDIVEEIDPFAEDEQEKEGIEKTSHLSEEKKSDILDMLDEVEITQEEANSAPEISFDDLFLGTTEDSVTADPLSAISLLDDSEPGSPVAQEGREENIDDILSFGEGLGSASISGKIDDSFSSSLDSFESSLTGLSAFDVDEGEQIEHSSSRKV